MAITMVTFDARSVMTKLFMFPPVWPDMFSRQESLAGGPTAPVPVMRLILQGATSSYQSARYKKGHPRFLAPEKRAHLSTRIYYEGKISVDSREFADQ